jgi:hypothetical protein
MPFYERGPVRIHYEEVGSGFCAKGESALWVTLRPQ